MSARTERKGEGWKIIILPLAYRENKEKVEKIRETVTVAAKLQDRSQQLFALAGLLAFTDKVIDNETASKIKGAIKMTKVGRLFEEEKLQAIAKLQEESRQAIAQAEEENRQALTKAEEKNQQILRETVIKMIQKDYTLDEIVSIVSFFSQDEIEAIRKEIAGAGKI